MQNGSVVWNAGIRSSREREFFIGNLLVQIHFIIAMIWWTGLAPWEFEVFFLQVALHLPSKSGCYGVQNGRVVWHAGGRSSTLALNPQQLIHRYIYRGSSLIRNCHPYRTTVGP